ncbi:co-regulatory protein PtrA N-terminal domain-containing protein [Pseudomonas sp. G(2018)]|uniref:co-regulatory protein PtrA N-terminal domain-containing protein n=1 Tax=Pseudomonas sp. G(2018) TaxID=2502242 RepID=UPI0010F98B7D|nr:co-regulatory protein PtrA N-terminal domain-containing protein [Pseudomonas sp. G(2018)]
MKLTNVLMLSFTLAVSSLALAEGGGDRTFERLEKAQVVAMEAHKASTAATVDRDVVLQKAKPEKPHG